MSHLHYEREGVVQLPAVVPTDEIDAIRSAFMDQVERDRSVGWDDNIPDGDPLSRYPRFVQPHRRQDTEVGRLARRWMLDPRILDVITELIGPALAAQSMFYFKPPSARGQALHQDNFFLQAHPETCIAAWIAVDDCDAENGGLEVVPGSHKHDLTCPEEADMTRSFTRGEVAVPAGLRRVQTEMKAGDVLFFHGSLVHGSQPNTSADRFRRSLIFHYVPESSREIARFYQPLMTPDGVEIMIDESTDGGPCGESWQPAEAH
jgi:phytanoyl-CoA hydroxylase